MFADTLLILFISLCTALLSEGKPPQNMNGSDIFSTKDHFLINFVYIGILYLLVYRTENYKRLKATVEKQSKKCMLSPIS